jgi:hypothetical protein
MTDKIRIVGSFGDQVVEQVQAFLIGLHGVTTASVLRDGQELLPQPEQAQEGAESGAEAA